MALVTMKENLQEEGKKKEKKDVIRRETRVGIGIVTKTGIGREARTELGREARTGIGRKAGTEKKIVIVILEITTGNVVGNTVRGGEIEMMMIISEAETMTGNYRQTVIEF